jgi:hypothetical protein
VADIDSGVALAAEGWDLICYHGDVWLLQTAIRQGIDGIRSGFAASPKPAKKAPEGKSAKKSKKK